MAILIDENTRVIVQGITGAEGLYHARACRDYGTAIVGGVSPGKGGRTIEGFSVFNSVAEAKVEARASASLIFVPPAAAFDAILEALDAEIRLIVCITEGVPIHDMLRIRRILPDYPASRLIGPNCPGVISPGRSKVGIMPGEIHARGHVGVVSRSGTLMYEAVSQLGSRGLGESTCVGIGGDFIVGSSFVDVLKLFEADPETDMVLLIGEIGGEAEEQAAAFCSSAMQKPLAAFVAGQSAPKNRRMGHAGAIAGSGSLGAAGKLEMLKKAGATVILDPACIGEAVAMTLASH